MGSGGPLPPTSMMGLGVSGRETMLRSAPGQDAGENRTLDHPTHPTSRVGIGLPPRSAASITLVTGPTATVCLDIAAPHQDKWH